MDNADKELLEVAQKSDIQIKRLYDQHKLLDRKIETMLGRTYLSNSDDLEIRTLKKQKLVGKEMLMKLLEDFRLRTRAHSKLN